jgi:TatD DNase family protein
MTTMSSSTTPPLIDVDCNLWHEELQSLIHTNHKGQDETETITENSSNKLYILEEDAVSEHNIQAMLSPSSTIQEAKDGIAILQQYQGSIKIKTTVGVHPYHVNDDELKTTLLQEHVTTMKQLLLNNPSLCVAVGECGLDASEGFPPIHDQIPWFQAQVQLAQELQLPLFVHERLAFETCMQLLEHVTVPIIIHCFTGTLEECQAYIERGYSLSLSGYLFKTDAEQTRQCLQQNIIPLNKLMVETDAPYMGFAGCRDHYVAKHVEYVDSLNSKKRKRLVNSIYPNLPSALPMVLDKVLEELNHGRSKRGEVLLTREELASCTTCNANSFFRFET